MTNAENKVRELHETLKAHPAFGKDFNNAEVKTLMRKLSIWQHKVAKEGLAAQKAKRPTAFSAYLCR